MGPVARWLRRPMFWTTGMTVGGVLFLTAVIGVGVLCIAVLVIAYASRSP